MPKVNIKDLAKKYRSSGILVPHIDTYQAIGDIPDVWNVEIRNTKEKDPYFHPSGDTYTSPKQLYKEKTGLVNRSRPNAALRRVFDCGHFWHGYYQNILTEMGFVTPENVERTFTVQRRNFTGRGTLDLYQVEIPNHGQWIIDIKTVGDVEYDEGFRKDILTKYKAQLFCYADWTGCENLMILAVRKGGTRNPISGAPQHALKEIIVEYDQSVVDEIYDRWELAQRYIDGEIEVDLN